VKADHMNFITRSISSAVGARELAVLVKGLIGGFIINIRSILIFAWAFRISPHANPEVI
jgi:hypothetical protein